MRRWVTLMVTFAVLTVAGVLLIASFRTAWWWFEVHTGTVNESGPYYGFFSGFGSDLAEASIFAGLITAARHVNCHTRNCWRVGHKVTDPATGHTYRQCVRHDPHVSAHAHQHWWQHHFTDEHLAGVHARIAASADQYHTDHHESERPTMSNTTHKYARGLQPLDHAKLALLPTADDLGHSWPAATFPFDLRGGVEDLGMGGNGPDPTLTIPGGPFGNCGPNAGPKNVDQTTAALGHITEVAWTSDRTTRLYFVYQAETAGITWRPPALGATWSDADAAMAKKLDLGVDPVDWLVWLATHDEDGNVVPVGQGLIEAFVKVEAAELELAGSTARAVMVAVALNDQADDQFDAWQEGTNPAGWDVGPGDESDPEEGHFIILGSAQSASGPYTWGSWGQFVPSTYAWRKACVQVGFAVLTKEDVGQAFYDAAAQVIAELGGTVPAGA